MSVRPQVVVYVKSGHPSSASAVATLERVQAQVPFDLQKTDVADDPELSRRFGGDLPVVTINGQRAFSQKVPEGALKRRLKKAKGGSSGAEAAEPVVVESLEAFEPAAPRVPTPIMVLVLVLVLAAAGYFVREGIAEAAYGRGRLARQLLRVKARDQAPPSFALESFDGQQIRSDARFRGKVVFINFWATWCPPCVEEMPSMLRLQAKMGDDPNFSMVAISTDEGWGPVRQFFERPPPFDVLLDKEGDLAREYGTEKFPETYIVVDGRLVGYIVGPRDWDTWYAEAYLRALIEHGLAL